MSHVNGTQSAAWPSVGTIHPKPEETPPEVEVITQGTAPASPVETEEEIVAPEVVAVPEKVTKPSFESTLEDWVLEFKPKSKWSVYPYVKWWLYTRLRLFKYERITPPETLSRRAMWDEIRDVEAYVVENRRVQFITATTSSGGGKGKTTDTDTIAAYTSMLFRNGTALIGLDLGADKTVSRFQKESGKVLATTTLVQLLAANRKFYVSHLVRQTDSDAETGLVLFKAIDEEDKSTRDYSEPEVISLLQYMNQLYPALFIDGGPGLNLINSNGIMKTADIFVLPMKGVSGEQVRDVRNVIENPPYQIAGKEDRVIVPVNAVTKKKLNTRTQWNIAKRLGIDPRHVVLIPQENYLDDEEETDLKRVSIPALRLKTRLMFARLMKLNVQIAQSLQPIEGITDPQEKNHA